MWESSKHIISKKLCNMMRFSFSLHEIECLGACINAPVIKINNNYYENLKLDDIKKIVKNLKK